MEETLNYYEKGLKLAEAGKYQEAFDCICQYLRTAAGDVQAINDAGAILHCLGRSQEAIEYFTKARKLKSDSSEIIWNLVEANLALGKADCAAEFFDEMEQMEILNADTLNRTANIFLNQNDKAGAVEMLLKSTKIASNQEILSPMLEVIRSKRPKIAFFCGADGMTFLNDIIEFAKQRFQIRVFQGQTEQELYELMKWSDISWFEWCTNFAAAASKLPKVCKNIIRLHRYEAYGIWPPQVQWDNIDMLITVGNSAVKDVLVSRVADIQSRTSMVTIANGVNLDKLSFSNRNRGKNIAFLANLRMVKNPAFLLQCMQKLHYIDKEYRLFIGGISQDITLEQYLRHMINVLGLNDVVFFDGWQGDVNSWLADKHYIVSTSIMESQGMGLLEAMSCGLKPVIHNFPGASEIYPSEFLFNISEEFCEQILSETYDSQKYRQFVEKNYSLKNQLNKINGIFTQFESQIDLQKNEQAKPAIEEFSTTAAEKTDFQTVNG